MPPDLTRRGRAQQDADIGSPPPSCGSAEYTSIINGGGLELTQRNPAIPSHGSRGGQVASEERVTSAAGVGTNGATPGPVVPNTYLLAPQLRNAFSSVGATNCAYSFREVLLLLKKYLYSNVHLFDPIDRNYINCKSDPLEKAFGVTRFHFTDVRGLISQNIIRVQPAKGCIFNQGNQPVPDSLSSSVCVGGSNDNTCRLSVPPGAASCIPVSESQSSQGAQNSPESIAAPRVEAGPSRVCESGQAVSESGSPPPAITCPDIPDSCSDAETVYTVQDYETEYCRNTEFESSEDDVEEVNSETFEEYELPSDDGNDEKKEFSDSDSTIDNVEIALFYTLVQDDLEEGFWADDDSDTDEDQSDDYDPECVSDRWDCLTCGLKNKPFVRYCSKCWQLRKNWLPDRPKKRRRKPRPKKRNLRKAMASNSSEQQSSSQVETSSKDHRTRAVSESSADESSQTEDLTRDISSVSTTVSVASCSSNQDSGFSSQDLLEIQDFAPTVKDIQQPKTCSSRKRRSSSIDDVRSSKRSKGEESEDGRFPEDVDTLAINISRFISSSEGKTWLRSHEGIKYARSLKNSPSYQEAQTKVIAEQISSSTPGTSSEVSMLCSICCLRPKNASIIHGRLAHQATCYQCAKRLLNEGARCPVCRRKIHMDQLL